MTEVNQLFRVVSIWRDFNKNQLIETHNQIIETYQLKNHIDLHRLRLNHNSKQNSKPSTYRGFEGVGVSSLLGLSWLNSASLRSTTPTSMGSRTWASAFRHRPVDADRAAGCVAIRPMGTRLTSSPSRRSLCPAYADSATIRRKKSTCRRIAVATAELARVTKVQFPIVSLTRPKI